MFAGGVLVWSIFAWYADKRDKLHENETKNFYKNFYDFETRYEKRFSEMSLSYNKLIDELSSIKTQYAVSQNEMQHVQREFRAYVVRINKVVERHDLAFENLGKVINLDKK